MLLGACASEPAYDATREWQRAECNRKVDRDDRERCLKRVNEEYGRRSREEQPGERGPRRAS